MNASAQNVALISVLAPPAVMGYRRTVSCHQSRKFSFQLDSMPATVTAEWLLAGHFTKCVGKKVGHPVQLGLLLLQFCFATKGHQTLRTNSFPLPTRPKRPPLPWPSPPSIFSANLLLVGGPSKGGKI